MTSAGETREERVAANEATFRRANQALYNRFRELDADGLTPFLCECGDERCTLTLRASFGEYEDVRREPGRFLVIPGHHFLGFERVVEENDRFDVVEKPLLRGESGPD